MSVGADGCAKILSSKFGGGGEEISSSCALFHYQRGGIKRLAVTGDCGRILAVDTCGSMQLLDVKREKLPDEEDGGGLVLVEPRPSLAAESDQTSLLLAATSPPELTPESMEKPWSARKEKRQTELERRKHEKAIVEIGRSLGSVRGQVSALLDDNSQLPEEERLDRRDFELDSEEKFRRIHEGQDREVDLRLELKAEQWARKKMAQNIRQDVWDDMAVKGKAVQVGPRSQMSGGGEKLHNNRFVF